MTTPTTSAAAQGFQPAFKRVQQSESIDDAFACIAMLAGKTLAEVKQAAVQLFGHPANGPYWITEDLIQKLLAHFGWVATVYKESTGIASLPEYAIGMVEYNLDTDIGRHVIFHRMPASGNNLPMEYVIDPAGWISPDRHIRTDIKGFPITWYIGVNQMKAPPAKAAK